MASSMLLPILPSNVECHICMVWLPAPRQVPPSRPPLDPYIFPSVLGITPSVAPVLCPSPLDVLRITQSWGCAVASQPSSSAQHSQLSASALISWSSPTKQKVIVNKLICWVCGWYEVSTWSVCGWYVVGMWSVKVVVMWSVTFSLKLGS